MPHEAAVVKLVYLIAAVLFIVGLKGMCHPRTAVQGNMAASLGMLLAVVITLLDERINQHLKGGSRFVDKFRILRARLDEAPEHHPVMGGVRNGEVHVRDAHRLEALATFSVPLPRIAQRQAQHAKALAADCRDERLLVGEVTV